MPTISKKDWEENREKFMTERDIREINTNIDTLLMNKGNMGDLYARWEDEETAYKGDQEKISNRPNSRVNIINANVEGQVSSLIEQNIAVVTKGESPTDGEFAKWARVGLDWSLRKNKIKRILDVHERRRLKFGTGIFKVYFDENALGGFGLATIKAPPLNKVYIDGKIKDILRYQEAEYIAEEVTLSKTQMIELYGEEKANAVNYGASYIEDTAVFGETYTNDDQTATTVIMWVERCEGRLRMREFSGCGVLLYDSHKEGTRKDNQKGKEYKHVSYYKYVNDKYPYFFTSLYVEEGSMYGFGDCKLLLPIQNMINDLYDKIRMNARPNLILFDPSSEVDLTDFDDNSLEPRPAMLDKKTVEVVQWGQVNPALWNLLSAMHQEAQRVTRYSELMMGQSKSADTATEAAIQQQQGNATTDHKKTMLQETLVEVCEYMLGLMMQFYQGAKAFRVDEDKEEFEWIDFRKLSNVPVMKPATESYMREFKKKNPDSDKPKWEIISDKNGRPKTKQVELDIEINIGAGLPKNKTFLWRMMERLASMQVLDEYGQPKGLVSYEEMRKLMSDLLGLPIMEDDQKPRQPIQQPMSFSPLQENINADNPLTTQGKPTLSAIQGGVVRGDY